MIKNSISDFCRHCSILTRVAHSLFLALDATLGQFNEPMDRDLKKFQTLVEIMAKLRAPGGCPWDREQTHVTLAPYAIEEAAELSEAIHDGDHKSVVEELGDVLLQVVFHAEVGREAGVFTIEDVIEAISSKLIRRHPHVFGDVKVSGASEVVDNWEEIKKGEKEKRVRTDRMDVPLGLPALQRAQKIGDKTKKEKFDWDSAAGVMKKLEEEIAELKSELAAKNKSTDKVRMETGDILFTAAQLARHLKLDAEQTLREANQKFERRYMRMRELVSKDGADWTKLSDPEKEAYWSKIKMAEHT